MLFPHHYNNAIETSAVECRFEWAKLFVHFTQVAEATATAAVWHFSQRIQLVISFLSDPFSKCMMDFTDESLCAKFLV